MLLGKKYKVSENENLTRERIMLNTTKLFAMYGYDAVSVKDIADSIGIKPGSLYNHYESKEALLNTILDRFEMVYTQYFHRLETANENASTLEEVIGNFFVENKEVVNMFAFYGMAIVIKEQFNIPRAKDLYLKVFMGESRKHIRETLERLAREGKCKEADMDTIATIIMSCVMTGCNLTLQEETGVEMEYGFRNMYHKLEQLLISMLKMA